MKTLSIVQVEILRTVRDRRALFFSVVLPFVLILVLGLAFGGNNSARIGVLDEDGTTASRALLADVTNAGDVRVEAVTYPSVDALRDAAARGLIQLGLAIPSGYGSQLSSGGNASLTEISTPTQAATAVQTIVARAVAFEQARFRAALFAVTTTGLSFDRALDIATQTQTDVPGVVVQVESVGAPTVTVQGFEAGAQSQLILFMFLTALTGATSLVVARRLGIARRMFATPTPVRTIIVGESLARTVIAVLQGLLIVFASSALFGVAWGDPVATAALVVTFAFVCAGGAMLIGSLSSNESQAGALGPALGMLLALFGGAMVPVEVFPQTMRTLSWLTPHAWAIDAFVTLRTAGQGIPAILPQLAVLAVFAIVLLGLASLRLRRVLANG